MAKIFRFGFKVLDEHRMTIEVRKGVSNIEIMNDIEKIKKNHPELQKYSDVLLLVADQDLDMIISQLEEFCQYLSTMNEVLETRFRIAAVTKTSHHKAYAHAFKKSTSEFFDFTDFDKIDDALIWLGKSISTKEVLQIEKEILKFPLIKRNI